MVKHKNVIPNVRMRKHCKTKSEPSTTRPQKKREDSIE